MKTALRRSLIGLLALVLIPFTALAETNGVTANGKPVTFDVQPAVVDSVVMVPIRAVAEALGGQVAWNDPLSTATIVTGTTTIEFTVGKAQARINGRAVALAAPVVLQRNRVLVPAGFLLTYFGSQVSVSDPALKDPAAMDLLEKGRKSTPTDADFQMKQTMVVGMTGVAPEQAAMTITMQGQVRGQDTLVVSSLQSPQIPGGATASHIAIKGGRAFMKAGPAAWQPIPVNLAAAQALQSLNSTEVNTAMVKEAHLRPSRTVGGQVLQDVVVTYDLAVMKALTDQVLKSLLPADAATQLAFTWENLTGTTTLDQATGRSIAQTMDVAVSMAATAQGETMNMHMVVHVDMTMTASTQPIAWPSDLPQ